MRLTFALAAMSVWGLASCAMVAPASQGASAPRDYVREKALPLIALLERDRSALAAIKADPELAGIAAAYRERAANAAATCAVVAACYTAAERMSPDEIARIEAAL